METKMENRKKAMVALAVIAAVALCSAGVLMMSDDVEADTPSTVTAEGDNGTEDLCAIAFVTVTTVGYGDLSAQTQAGRFATTYYIVSILFWLPSKVWPAARAEP